MHRRRVPVCFSVMLLLAAARTVSADPGIFPSDAAGRGRAWVELLRPEFGALDLDALSSVWFLGGEVDLGPAAGVKLEIPVARFDVESFGTSPQSALGNVYLAGVARFDSGGSRAELGIYLPTADEAKPQALVLGGLTDLDRWEAFFSNSVTPRFRMEFRTPPGAGPRLKLDLGGTGVIPTEGEGDVEIWILYGAALFMEDERGGVSVGVSGRFWATADDIDGVGERTLHELRTSVFAHAGRLTPGVYVRAPLDRDLRQTLKGVYGLYLAGTFE